MSEIIATAVSAAVEEMRRQHEGSYFWTDVRKTGGMTKDGVMVGVDGPTDMEALVRVIVTALREPSEKMAWAGYSVACKHDNGLTAPAYEISSATYRSMIDEALKDG